MRAAVAVIVVAIAVAVATTPGAVAAASRVSCDDAPGSGTAQAAPGAGAGVTRVDYAFAHRVAGECRRLPTQVRFPTGNAAALPLMLVIHGADGDPSRLAPLLDVWTQAGYVVAAPTFLKTKKDARGKALKREVAQQAADARFVLDDLLDRGAELHADDHEIGVAGMSLGGMTVYGLISHTCCQDGRIRAAIVMAGVHDDFPDGKYVHQSMPVLLVQGDADVGYHHSQDAYPQLAPPKWFITLHGEGHSPPFEIPRGVAAGIVDATTTAFWNRYLKHEPTAARQIVAAVAATNGKSTLRKDLSSR